MDRIDWLMRIESGETPWISWKSSFEVVDTLERGTRTAWALNLLEDICDQCECSGYPEKLPCDTRLLRCVVNKILDGKSSQLQCKAILMLRRMLASHPIVSQGILDAFPRHRKSEKINPVVRQKRIILEDALPKKGLAPWMQVLFRDIMEHSASVGWRTSKSANQNLNMVHKFFRCTGLLACDSLETFNEKMQSLSPNEIERMCLEFTDKFCSTDASARRYLVVFNHIFHKVYATIPYKIKAPKRSRRVFTRADLEDKLSQCTAASSANSASGRVNGNNSCDYFDEKELESIKEAAKQGDHAFRDTLIVTLLETSGLRRMGLLNIMVVEVAERGDETHEWVPKCWGRTLTKGNKWQNFQIYANVREALQNWLNTVESKSGRPSGPSPFLFPSLESDNGQMSTTTLSRVFRDICIRAGFKDDDNRLHLHAMRHSCAHLLSKRGNTAKQISLVLGHSTTQITESVYLRDNVERGCADLAVPKEWTVTQHLTTLGDSNKGKGNEAGETMKTETGRDKEKKKSSRDIILRTLRALEQSIQHG